jgi:succinoglycan biosynthesis protein ExoA
MTDALPLVSILIPARNEAADIEGCIAAVAEQTWPSSRVEVLLVDALSEDQTVRVATDTARRFGIDLVVCDNPGRHTSIGLNVGLARCTGEYVVRVDARSRIGPCHVERAVQLLSQRVDVAVVGGGQRAVERSDRVVDRCIARALRNRYTTGLARYRRSRIAGAADTVWMGAFRRADLVAVGGWSASMVLNEDWDLNERLRAAGKVVWFDPELDAGYLPRKSYRQLARQYFRFGRAKGTGWMRGRRPAPRHFVLLAAPPASVVVAAMLAADTGLLPVAGAALAAGVVIDAIGAREPAGAAVRLGSVTATAVSCGAWWLGVVAGAAGGVAGAGRARG